MDIDVSLCMLKIIHICVSGNVRTILYASVSSDMCIQCCSNTCEFAYKMMYVSLGASSHQCIMETTESQNESESESESQSESGSESESES